MDDSRWERIAVATGYAAVVLFLVGFLMPGTPPTAVSSIDKIRSFYLDKRTSLLVGSVLIWFGIVFFVWFAGAVRAHLSRHEGGTGRLATLALGGGLLAAAGILVGTLVPAALAYHIAKDADPGLLRALYDIGTVGAVLTAPGGAVFIGATTIATLRYAALPRWTAWVGIVAGLIQLLGTTPVFSTSGFLSPTGAVGYITFLSAMVWIVVVASTMLGRVGAAEAR